MLQNIGSKKGNLRNVGGFKATLPSQLWGTSLQMSVLGFSEGLRVRGSATSGLEGLV